MTWSAITDSGTWEAIPLELSVDLCILAKNGWDIRMTHVSDMKPHGYDVWARRWKWQIEFRYHDDTLTYRAGLLCVMRSGEPVSVRDLNRLEMRRAAVLSNEALDLEVVRG